VKTISIWAPDTGNIEFQVADDATDAEQLQAAREAQAVARAAGTKGPQVP
jgi:hypothetical protein